MTTEKAVRLIDLDDVDIETAMDNARNTTKEEQLKEAIQVLIRQAVYHASGISVDLILTLLSIPEGRAYLVARLCVLVDAHPQNVLEHWLNCGLPPFAPDAEGD